MSVYDCRNKNVFSAFDETLSMMMQMQCHLKDCCTALGQKKQIIGTDSKLVGSWRPKSTKRRYVHVSNAVLNRWDRYRGAVS